MKHSPGFTLIEVLVTITLLAVGIVTSLSVIRASADRIDRVQRHEQAAQLAATLLTEARLGVIGPGSSGKEGLFSWEIVPEGAGRPLSGVPMQPATDEAAAQPSHPNVQPVAITIRWGNPPHDSQLRVQSAALTRAQPTGN